MTARFRCVHHLLNDLLLWTSICISHKVWVQTWELARNDEVSTSELYQNTPYVISHSRDLGSQVISITDGEPAGEPNNTILHVIKGAKNLCANSPYGPGAIAFQIAQVRRQDPGPAASLLT